MGISEDELSKISEFYRDKEVDFILDTLHIFITIKNSTLHEVADFINQINPKKLKINRKNINFENIKTLVLLNCRKIEVNARNYKFIINSYLWFIQTPIQLFDSKSEQRMTFQWESIKFFIFKYKITGIKLLKTKTGNFLFIPFDTIWQISCSGFREILNADEINKQFGFSAPV